MALCQASDRDGINFMCYACVNIKLSESPASGSDFKPLHKSLNEFLIAIREGCVICVAIWNHMRRQEPSSLSLKLQPSFWAPIIYCTEKDRHVPFQYRIEIQYSCLFNSDTDRAIRFKLIEDRDDSLRKAEAKLAHDALEDFTGCSQSLRTALSWAQQCYSSHTKCTQYSGRNSSWLPTRLIDVGGPDSNVWKLRITATELQGSQPLPYIALSYRWGPNPDLLLLLSTLDRFRSGKPIDRLPRTFRDLVTVARFFQIRYLWIDALCIIQDSISDWDAEAPTMRMVYAHSFCTIAASSAPNEKGGLFRTREASSVKPNFISLLTTNPREKRRFQIVERDYWDVNVHSGPLHGRGWVFQERHLSTRVVHFTKHQILFECLQDARCEAFPDSVPNYVPDKSLDALLSFEITKCVKKERMPPSIYQLWRDHLKVYTHCALTKSDDCLPALAGLAKIFQEATRDEYIAGLWKSRLIEGLDWRVSDPRSVSPSTCRAPSWSWASIDGPCRPIYSGDSVRQLVSLIDVRVRPRGADPTGAVLPGGYLTLKGLLIQARKIRVEQDGATLIQVGPHTLSVDLCLDSTNIKVPDGRVLHCLPLNTEVPYSEEMNDVLEACIMVLLPVPGSLSLQYQRIGHFICDIYAKSLTAFGLIEEDERVWRIDPQRMLSEVNII